MKTITLPQVRNNWRIYMLVLPAIALILTFSYYPAASAMYHAFYRWNGDDVSEFIGLQNFSRALADETLAYSFGVVMIFIVSNLFKMIPSIATAVIVHRMVSDKSRYIYRVLFVIPMIIPGIVWLLIWKFFYDPGIGVLNKILNATGLMQVLQGLDVGMPWLASQIAPVREVLVAPVFGSTFGMAMAGVMVLSFMGGVRSMAKGWLWWLIILPGAFFLYGGPAWEGTIRWALIVAFCGLLAEAVLRNGGLHGREIIKWIGTGLLAIAGLLVVTSLIWTEQTNAFATGQPNWLGDKHLAVPAFIFWGFPWVGVVGVLLYLAGLGNISNDVYEAADIDGCGWFRKFYNIELPLITTQVRLNLVLMIINTLKGWGLVFIIFGDTGGPDHAVMVPGLYMFRKAFLDLHAGYGCAIGLILFVLILVLTLINNKYVRVEK